MNENIEPTKYPFYTSNYEDFLYQLTDNYVIKTLLTNWYTHTYNQTYDNDLTESNDSTIFILPNNVKLTDTRQVWFTFPGTNEKISKIIEKLKKRIAIKNNINDYTLLEHAFLILVPNAQTFIHIDRGKHSGTFLMVPIIGSSEITYVDDTKRFLIDRTIFASNNVWHNCINTSNSLAIVLLVNIPLDISKIVEYSTENALQPGFKLI